MLVARTWCVYVPMQAGRDQWLEDVMARQRGVCPAEAMDAESPLFILYTSSSTGKPKGVIHTTGGYLLYASYTHRLVFDIQPNDIHFCAADVGWVTGHSYIVYGPLANGTTTVMFESTPVYPNAGRYWQVMDDISSDHFLHRAHGDPRDSARRQCVGETIQARQHPHFGDGGRADQP